MTRTLSKEEEAAAPAEKVAPEREMKDAPPKPKALLGTRHMVSFMLFLCLAIAYSLRVVLSVTIVAIENSTTNPDFPTYNLTGHKDVVLSSFFWGYVVTQVPGGMLAQMLGGTPMLLGSIAITSVFTLLTPLAASGGWGYLCAVRVVQGLGQGVIFPSVHTLLSKWAPPAERGRLATYVYAGAQVGTIVGLPVAGALPSTAIGWPSVFYIFGALGVAWTVAWFFLGGNSPATHHRCSEEERDYIEGALGSNSSAVRPPTPWKSIFTSLPFWSLVVAHCGQNWGFWTLLTEMPSYMDGVLGYKLSDNGLLSALPYLVMWILSFFFSWISDFANGRNMLPLTVSRKIFNSIGHWGPAIALLGVGFVEEKASAVALLTVAVGLDAATYVGFQINHIDLSPNFAGAMMGVTNCAANIMSIIGPLVVGVVVTDNSSQEQWRVVFFIASGIYFVGNLTFVLLGSAVVQPWNNPTENLVEKNKDVEQENVEKKKDVEQENVEKKKDIEQ